MFSNEDIGRFYSPVTHNPPGHVDITAVEVQACALALITCRECGLEEVKINTDSRLIYNVVNKWMKQWKANDWKKSDGSKLTLNLK